MTGTKDDIYAFSNPEGIVKGIMCADLCQKSPSSAVGLDHCHLVLFISVNEIEKAWQKFGISDLEMCGKSVTGEILMLWATRLGLSTFPKTNGHGNN